MEHQINIKAQGSTKTLALAKKALALVHKQELSSAEADEAMHDTLKYWHANVNEGFLDYRKSVGDGQQSAALDWKDPSPGSALFADQNGTVYIDCLGGFGIFNCGRRHPEICAAVTAQLQKQPLHSQELLDPLRSYCAALLSSLMPSDAKRELTHVFFTNSGTESMECCLKMALLSTGRKHILACVGAFHGKSLGSLSLTSKSEFRGPFLGALARTTHLPFNDIVALEQAFKSSAFSGELVACLCLEPVQGEGGIHVASAEYLQAARRLCDTYGAKLVMDEVQSGMGRTGTWWRCEAAGVVPDLMAVGKGFGGGVMPVGACVGTRQVWEKYIESPFLHTSTFGGNPLALAAAIAAINVTMKQDLLRCARERGYQFLHGMKALQKKHPSVVREVRGVGLMLGIEFVENDFGVAFSKGMFLRRVLVSGTLINARVVRIEPPLTITEAQVDSVLKTMAGVLADIETTLPSLPLKSTTLTIPLPAQQSPQPMLSRL